MIKVKEALMKLKTAVSRYRILAVCIVIGIALISMYVYLQNRNQDSGQLDTKPPLYKDQIVPGETTTDEVKQKLGDPKSEAEFNDQTILNYDKKGAIWKDQVYTSEGKVTLVTEQMTKTDARTKKAFFDIFGEPEVTLYGPYSPSIDMYGYPSKGFAILGRSYSDLLFQIWYFPKMDKDIFINSLAKDFDYTTTPPVEKE